MVKIGNNAFFDVTVPVAFLNRYLIVDSNNPKKITVILNHGDKPIYEIFNSEPCSNPVTDVTKTSPGIITVSDKKGKFIYKIRPNSETSIMFGSINQDETNITIKDKEIKVNASVFTRNIIRGFGVGISVNETGSIAIGAPLPNFIRELIK